MKNRNILKFFDKKNIGSLPRIFISSIIVIFFFYSAPLIVSFANKDETSVKNSSLALFFLALTFLFFAWLFIETTHKDLCQMNISWFKKYLTQFHAHAMSLNR